MAQNTFKIGKEVGKAAKNKTKKPKEMAHLEGVRWGLTSLKKHVKGLKSKDQDKTALLIGFEKEVDRTLRKAAELLVEINKNSLSDR